ncbi:E3 ubiquitin-protein ligase Praja-2-like [Saccostrea cucullata]|uniref:E3 ubiquitin-protein ligase Praja-2-like n=1 Tax=Saccostrea cuccullata TaxID=36930 RepID=UPI002ED4E08D
MDENKEENHSKHEQSPHRIFENAQKVKKKDAKKLVSDSDSCECQFDGKHIKAELKRKPRSGSNQSKCSFNSNVKSGRTLTVPCSSSEACEYDKENGEDEDEGETTQTEYPELSSLLHDLCSAKYSNNLNENKIKSSAIQPKNRRDSKTQRPNLRSAESNEPQSSEAGTIQEQGTSQTCDFISGLHYAIPFLSDKLKSSLFSRLRCQSEPKEIGATKSSKDQETDHCDYDSSDSGSFVLEENPGLDNKHLPLCCQDYHEDGACCHEDSGACCHDNESQTVCSGGLTEVNNESQSWSRISPARFKENTGYSHFHHGCCNYHSNHCEKRKQDQEFGDNHHDHDTGMIQSDYHDSGSQCCSCEQNGEMYDNCHIDNSNDQARAGVSEDHHSEDIEDSYSGVLSEDSIFGTITSEEEQVEESVSRIAEDVEKIDLLGHFLEERDETSSEGSEMVPDLFSSLSSDSCQADDEFECDCGHCVGSGPGHHDNDLDLDWQVARRLESSTRGVNSHTQNRDPEELSSERTPLGASVTSDPEDDDIEEGVYRFSLLPPLNSEQLEAMFERMIAQLQDINLGGGTEQAPPPASTSTIESLPYNTVNAHQIDDLAPCSICLSSFVVMDTTSHLSCNHLFHLHCIKAWLTKSATCPVCRYRVESPTAP